MPRALLSVSDKTGIVAWPRGLPTRGFELVSTGGTAQRLADAGLPGDERLGDHRFSRNDGRPREDAASGAARRHPRAARPSRRPRRRRRPTASASSIVVVVNLYPFVKRPREPRRRRSMRSSKEIDIGGPRWCARPRRISATCWSSSTRPTTTACSRRSTQRAGQTLAFRFELDAEGDRAHRRLRHGDRRDARRRSTFAGGRFDAGRAPGESSLPPRHRCSICRRSATSATARTRTSRRPGTRRADADSGFGAAHDPAGQGAVVHEPARSRRGRAHRARVRRAGGRR